MSFPVLADAGLSLIFKYPIESWALLGAVFLMISLVEAVVLWRFKLASLQNSFWSSMGMNFASAFLGFVLTLLGPLMYMVFFLAPLGLVGSLLIVLLLWGLSIAVEAGVLLVLKWKPAKQVWKAVTTANTITYGVPLLFWLLLVSVKA